MYLIGEHQVQLGPHTPGEGHYPGLGEGTWLLVERPPEHAELVGGVHVEEVQEGEVVSTDGLEGGGVEEEEVEVEVVEVIRGW